jgi:alpha-L-fucosidase
MRRRELCKLVAAAAAANALRLRAQSNDAAQSNAFRDFNTPAGDYAKFCATPSHERQFYGFENGTIAMESLDEKSWKPTEWGEPPALTTPGGSWDGVPMESPVPNLVGEGPFKPTWDSLLQYEAPEWYRDAKFGIWAHWSPQCVPEAGDWYARNMYLEGSEQNKYHLAHYGPPTRFGYKDLCAQWTLLNWEPEELIQRYKSAGARLFIALANHHDSFDAWDSKHQPWNAVALGPHRDVVGTWAAAARKQDMRFGVTVHQARNWWWFQTSHGSDNAGIAYDGDQTAADGKGQWWDGLDPQRLYGVKHPFNALPDISFVKNFYDRTRDLIDQHDPDLLYFDNSRLPLGWAGMNIGAYFYNRNLKTHSGRMEAILNVKQVPDNLAKAVIADYERGLTSNIMPYPWQSETCIGDWHYNLKLCETPGEFGGYLPPRDVIHWLIDTVSKNGTFILNVPGKPDGTIDSKEIAVIDKIGAWMRVNGEAIYSTRPWKVSSEGPNAVEAGSFQGASVSQLGAKDIRFTRNKANTVVYAIVLGWPTEPVLIKSFGASNANNPGKVANVQLIGCDERLSWKQSADGLSVELPRRYKPATDYAASLKIFLS